MSRLRTVARRGRRTFIGAALAVTVAAATGGWAVGNAQSAVTGPAPGAAAWRADRSLGVRLPDPATARPADVARFFAALTDGQRQALVARHPLTVGNLDGAPPALRYAANSRALTAERERQLARATDPAGTLQDHRRARKAAARCASLLSPGRRILAFDPRGRGQVAEVYGDLAAAERTAVIVPGSDIDLSSFDRARDPYGTPAGMARSLRTRLAADAPGTRTAVIAWAGYTTPVGIAPDATTGRLADAGAPRLARFLSGLAGVGAPAPAVLCHSYGSVVCGLAVPRLDGGGIADLVVFGSPGIRRDNVAELRTSARVWAARDASDWIGDIPNVELLGLGHGADPTDPAFGARRVPAERAVGHTGYFAPGTDSLRNFTAIVLGRYGAVR
ncbi:alpha/beta hydrolase [Streptomyces decoyicus]|uniref:alpha/beta hydrolase n=1 Tax=Streptomyces decoyicus TaxID=249567 RepID=UPI00345CDB8B